MDLRRLERRCIESYGEEIGMRLFDAMKKVARNDFCVATGWDNHGVSISRQCSQRGTLCSFSDNYSLLIFPTGHSIPIKDLTYSRIEKHLKKYGPIGNYSHCGVDNNRKRV
jgi:hypothetical protein